jgi:predicted chitinase
VQLTGRSNYAKYGTELGWPLVGNPDRANDSWGAAILLAKFLKSNEKSIREALRRGDVKAARRLVNGGSNNINASINAITAGRAFLQKQIAADASRRLIALAGTR